MKKNMLWIALGAFLIPIFARGLWFYRGFNSSREISTPDYQALVVSKPPLETPQDEKIKQTKGTVLFDYAHVNLYQAQEIQSLKDAIGARGGNIETLTDPTMLEAKLKYASAYAVISPTFPFTADETRIVRTFVERGGRLIVFTDPTHGQINYDFFTGATTVYSDATAVNPLLAPFGITINNDYLYNLKEHEGNFRNVFFDDFGKNELTFGLKRVALYGTHSIKSTSGLILLQESESTLSSIDDASDPTEGGAVISENGNVLALGDVTFLNSPYQNADDNFTLIRNIADFMLGGRQTPQLINFPYIFTKPNIQIFPTTNAQLTAGMISAIGRLQSSLRYNDLTVELVEEAPREGDALVLGVLSPSDDLLKYTDAFNITLDDSSEYVTVPGFGKIGKTGNGLLLFEPNKNGNTLILLADTTDDLAILMDSLSSGSLYGCVTQGDIGVCSVGYGGSFSTGSTENATGTSETNAGQTTPTPVASGQFIP